MLSALSQSLGTANVIPSLALRSERKRVSVPVLSFGIHIMFLFWVRFVYGIGRHQFLKHTSQSLEQLVFVCYELFTLDYIIELLKPHCLRRQSTADTQWVTFQCRIPIIHPVDQELMIPSPSCQDTDVSIPSRNLPCVSIYSEAEIVSVSRFP